MHYEFVGSLYISSVFVLFQEEFVSVRHHFNDPVCYPWFQMKFNLLFAQSFH